MKCSQQTAANRSQLGFSLIELMIVLVIAAIILGVTFSLLRNSLQVSATNYEVTNVQQQLRNAQEYIARDVISVGDGFQNTSLVLLPTEFVGNYLSSQSAFLDSTNSGYVSASIVLADNNVAAGTNILRTVRGTTALTGSDRLTLLTFDPQSVNNRINFSVGTTNPIDGDAGTITLPSGSPSFRQGDIIYVTNAETGCFGVVTSVSGNVLTLAQGDAFGINRVGETGSNISPIKRIATNPNSGYQVARALIIHWFVDNNNVLKRRTFGTPVVNPGDEGFTDETIAENVTSLNFSFPLVPNNSSEVFTSPVDNPTSIEHRNNIRGVESAIEIETAEPLSDGNHAKFTSVVQVGIRNLQYRLKPVPTPTPTPTPPTPGTSRINPITGRPEPIPRLPGDGLYSEGTGTSEESAEGTGLLEPPADYNLGDGMNL